MLEVTIPGSITTQLALPWGGFPHPVWFKDHPQIANVRAFGGILDRSIMEGVIAGERDYRRSSGRCRAEEQRSPRGARRRRQAGLPPRENRRRSAPSTSSMGAATSTERIRVYAHGPGAYLQTGLIQAFAAAPPRAPAAAQGRLRLARARRSATASCSRRSRPTASCASKWASRRRELGSHSAAAEAMRGSMPSSLT